MAKLIERYTLVDHWEFSEEKGDLIHDAHPPPLRIPDVKVAELLQRSNGLIETTPEQIYERFRELLGK